MNLELKVPPVAAGLIVAVAMGAAARWLPGLAFTLPGRMPLALAIALAGVAIALAGVAAFRRRRTTVDPRTPERASAIVDTGVYRVSRNPMYVGMLTVLVGWAVFLANWAALLMLPAFVAYIHRFQIVPEERALTARFGPAYAAYQARVRRWL
jgi:protein-S-isoprenylcysteine O-methyltransferase Ste14